MIRKQVLLLIFIFSTLVLASCAGPKVYQVDLLPAPEIFAEGLVNPFPKEMPFAAAPYHGILYATDRLPAEKTIFSPEAQSEEVYYKNQRGTLLRLGVGRIEIDRRMFGGRKDITWDEVRRISLENPRSGSYPLQIKQIKEFGILDRSYHPLLEKETEKKTSANAGKKYASLINKKLAISKRKDIYIYVHGYNTPFEDPLLVGSELWHYMGYDGVFIAYSWPATPRGLAYLADLDTARLASRNLRIFLEYLSDETEVENIHIIGYSMGTRVTTYALQDMALIHKGKTHEQIHKKIQIGNVMLIGSDLERGVFAGFMLDGILNVPKTFTVYMSDTDSAMSASRWLFERHRLGEAWQTHKPPQFLVDYLRDTPKLRFIDVTSAKDAATGNGHHYFIESPWVSSDLIMTLLFDLPPERRGLVKDQYQMWSFGEGHMTRLRESLGKMDPKLLDVNLK